MVNFLENLARCASGEHGHLNCSKVFHNNFPLFAKLDIWQISNLKKLGDFGHFISVIWLKTGESGGEPAEKPLM